MKIEYVKGIPYFDKVNHEMCKQYPYLEDHLDIDVLIIGGGISGAIACYTFAERGIKVALVDKGRIGKMNTSLATALLEYQLDDFAEELSPIMTNDEIANCYKLNQKGLSLLHDFINKYGNSCDYAPRDTLIYSLDKKDREQIRNEYRFRKEYKFDCEYIDDRNNEYGCNIEQGLLSHSGGAECNPYLLTLQLLSVAESFGAQIYENTEVMKVTKSGKGVVADINYGLKIRSNKVIISTGYNNDLLPNYKLCDRKLTYSIVTCPLSFIIPNNALMHDVEVPYHYLRSTADNRIIIGGEDKPYFGDTIKSNVAEKKYVELYKYLIKLFPQINGEAKIDYKFCGAFADTANNMGVIGELEPDSSIWCLFGYGANGIIYNFYGSTLLLDLYDGKTNPNSYLFAPTRKVF